MKTEYETENKHARRERSNTRVKTRTYKKKKASRWTYECKTFWNGKLKTLK